MSEPRATPTIASATTTRLVAREDLSSRELSSMFHLLCAHFEGVTREQFGRDLDEKNWVMLIERDGRLVGFTTIRAYETTVGEGEGSRTPVSIIYSGDTIVSQGAWNSSALPRGWIESVAALRRLYPNGPYFWLLITSGFRTYRFLPVFWREFYPRFDGEGDGGSRRLLDALAMKRFGDPFDANTGIVRLASPQRLRAELAGIPESRTEDPHVAFFATRNPGHADGDELVCLTELTPENLTPAGRRMAAAVPTW